MPMQEPWEMPEGSRDIKQKELDELKKEVHLSRVNLALLHRALKAVHFICSGTSIPSDLMSGSLSNLDVDLHYALTAVYDAQDHLENALTICLAIREDRGQLGAWPGS